MLNNLKKYFILNYYKINNIILEYLQKYFNFKKFNFLKCLKYIFLDFQY